MFHLFFRINEHPLTFSPGFLFHLLTAGLHIMCVLVTGILCRLEHTVQPQGSFSQRSDLQLCNGAVLDDRFQLLIDLAKLLIFLL